MPNAVVVTVSSKVGGSGFVVPYNHQEGLQLHRPAPGRPVQPVLYRVPIFEVRVEDAGTYKAVRFALGNNGKTPTTRPCDTGLSHDRSCMPAWLPYYSPHSFSGAGRQGAWRLIVGQGFLIHEGADSRRREVGGVEVGNPRSRHRRRSRRVAESNTLKGLFLGGYRTWALRVARATPPPIS